VHCALGSAHSRARPSGPAPLGVSAHDRRNKGVEAVAPADSGEPEVRGSGGVRRGKRRRLGVRFWAVERGETHCEWLSMAAALGRRRVIGGRPVKGSRLALKWTSRFLGLGRSWWPCRPGWRVDEESRHRRCSHRGGTRRHRVTCCRLQAAADGSGRRPKFGRCSRRSPRRSPTGGGWRGSARRYSVAEVNGEASRGEQSEEDNFESPANSAVDKQHRTVIACAARGGRKAGGSWSAVAGAVSRQRGGSSCLSGAGLKVSGVSDCSTVPGPIRCTVLFSNCSKSAEFLQFKYAAIPKSKNVQTWHGARVGHSEQLSDWVDFQFPTEFKLQILEQTPL
jgi:hypothetical protein